MKAWIRREFHRVWPHFDGSFGDFLKHAIENNRYDSWPRQHFRHDGYLFSEDIRQLESELKAGRVEFI